MTHLSSCYFCGIAVERPLQTFELPSSEETTTLTLCSACAEKLDGVLRASAVDTLEPVSDRQEPPVTRPEHQERSPEPANPGAASNGSSEEVAERTEADDSDGDGADTSQDDGPLPESSDPFSEDSFDDDTDPALEDEEPGEHEPVGDDELLPEDDPLATEEEDGFTVDISEKGTESTDELSGSGERSADGTDSDDPKMDQDSGGETSGPREASSGESSKAEQSGGGDGGAGGGTESDGEESTQSISALEYNRVMRMLQNREFPVDRDDIEIVAANAYDLRQSECAKVIDLAVDRGLLRERDGQLYRPDD